MFISTLSILAGLWNNYRVIGDLISILLIALGLSADCFAVSLSGGVSNPNYSRLQVLRAAFFFGLFQALMPLLGWLAGRTIVEFIESFDHWLAFGLLSVIGGKMIWEAFRHRDEEERKETDITSGMMLITLSVATSIDALAVGLSFAFLDVNIGLASPVIGIVAVGATILGFTLGRRAGALAGRNAEIIGGVILLVIAVRILLSHIL